MEYIGLSVIDRSQLKGVKPKMRGRKLRSVYWARGFKANRRKTRVTCV